LYVLFNDIFKEIKQNVDNGRVIQEFISSNGGRVISASAKIGSDTPRKSTEAWHGMY
jgi:hypothetical protein